MISHQFIDSQSGEMVRVTLDGLVLTTSSSVGVSEKEYENSASAMKEFQKEVWDKLHNGYVLKTNDKVLGEPYFHQFVGSDTMGAYFLASFDNKIAVCLNDANGEGLIHIFDLDGAFCYSINLPELCIDEIASNGNEPKIIIRSFDKLYSCDLLSGKSKEIVFQDTDKGSMFISKNSNQLFYGQSDEINLFDLKSEDILLNKRMEKPSILDRSYAFTGAVSESGSYMALHNREGEIDILAENGEFIKCISGEFRLLDSLKFCGDHLLFAKDVLDSKRVRCFNIKEGVEVTQVILKDESLINMHIDSFDIDEKNNRVLLTRRSLGMLYDLNTYSLIMQFEIENATRTCKTKFVNDDSLAVFTDSGCLSLYMV